MSAGRRESRDCELIRHGVKPRVVERLLAPHHETRGTALQPGVLEIIDRGGLIEPFLRAGVRIRNVELLGPGLQQIAHASFAGIGCKYEFQCSLPQWRNRDEADAGRELPTADGLAALDVHLASYLVPAAAAAVTRPSPAVPSR
jgi:FAD binding domain